MNQKRASGLWLISLLFITGGLLLVGVCCVGVFQLRAMATSPEVPRPADYPVAALVWNLYDRGGGPPEKPAVIAGQVQRTFFLGGLLGFALMVGGVSPMLLRRTTRGPRDDE